MSMDDRFGKRVERGTVVGQMAGRSPRANSRRIVRLLKVLQLLLAGSAGNISQLGKACNVGRRTAFRDIDVLRRAGLPVSYDERRDCYYIDSSFHLPITHLTPDESTSIITLAIEAGRSECLPCYSLARSAALKLENALPSAVREISRNVRRAVRIELGPRPAEDGNYAAHKAILSAHREGRVLEIEYDAARNEKPLVSQLRVYSFYFCRHTWYAIGRSSAHRSVQAFNIRRIKLVTPLGLFYKVPSDFSVEKFLGNAWGVNPSHGRDHDILIHFQPIAAQNVSQFRWHKTQVIQHQEDGSLLFRARVSGLEEIVEWILGFGDQAEVLSPVQLRQLVYQRALAMVARYKCGTQSHAAS